MNMNKKQDVGQYNPGSLIETPIFTNYMDTRSFNTVYLYWVNRADKVCTSRQGGITNCQLFHENCDCGDGLISHNGSNNHNFPLYYFGISPLNCL